MIGADRQQVQSIADRFIRLVANSRGLHLRMASAATDAHAAITFDVDPHASVVGDTGYRIVVDAEGIRVIARSPGGAFYAFPDVTGVYGKPLGKAGTVVNSSAEFAALALDEVSVAVVPGEAFGAPGHLRLSYAVSDADIEKGVGRLVELLS